MPSCRQVPSWPGLTRPSRLGRQCVPSRDPYASEATPFFERLWRAPQDEKSEQKVFGIEFSFGHAEKQYRASLIVDDDAVRFLNKLQLMKILCSGLLAHIQNVCSIDVIVDRVAIDLIDENKRVGARAAVELIFATSSDQHIIVGLAKQCVLAGGSFQMIHAVSTGKNVVCFIADNQIGPGAAYRILDDDAVGDREAAVNVTHE